MNKQKIGIFAIFVGEGQQGDVAPQLEPVVDPKSGGAGLPVNKYFCCHLFHLCWVALGVSAMDSQETSTLSFL